MKFTNLAAPLGQMIWNGDLTGWFWFFAVSFSTFPAGNVVSFKAGLKMIYYSQEVLIKNGKYYNKRIYLTQCVS